MGREDTHVYIVGTGAGGVWESQAEKALFCRSLTVENHLLSYQEMRPLGGGCDSLRRSMQQMRNVQSSGHSRQALMEHYGKDTES
jgi:hypothetical protein